MFTEKIKQDTLPLHQQVEKALVGRMKSIRSMEDYVALLKLFYGYFGGLELSIKKYINTEILPDFDQRRKTDAIADDIKMLGGSLPDIAVDDDLPKVDATLKAFGALYVIEGSTLGGKIIAGMMRKHLPFNGDEGLTFFNGYGDDSEPMWNAFKAALNAVAINPVEQETIISAANDTFLKFGSWIEK